MLVVALTGNIASGKSTVAQLITAKGVPLIDADVLARAAVAAGTPALAAIAGRWGAAMLAADGTLDRRALRKVVFADPAELAALNAIVHPEVARLRSEQMHDLQRAGAPIVLCDIPLLFEAGLQETADVIILVDAPAAVRLERLAVTRGVDRKMAKMMIDAQIPAEEKRAQADYVIDNNGSLEILGAAVDDVWGKIESRARAS